MEIDFQNTVGKKVDSCLVYTSDKQLFKIKRTEKDGAKSYVCYYKNGKCNAKIVIRDGICSYNEKFSQHSHAANQESVYEKINAELRIKQRCQSDPNLSLRQIFEEERGHDSDVDFEKVKSSMIRNKKKVLPKNPTTTDEVELYLETKIVRELLASADFLLSYVYIKLDDYAYLMFENTNILEKLPDERFFNISCTMRVVPDGFLIVLLTISAVKKHMAFPCIYVLLSDRGETAYDDVFRKIEEKWELDATAVWVDFERALRSAICNIYRDVITKSHWYQSMDVHGRQCSSNYNDTLKKKFCNPDNKCSFLKFIVLSKDEAKNMTSEYDELLVSGEEKKYSKTRRVTMFEKVRNSLNNGSIDTQMFLKQLTFVDNSGFVGNMNHYTVGDEHEIDPQNDGDRNEMVEHNLPIQASVQFHREVEPIPETSHSKCVICLVGPKDTMLVSCNHLKFCGPCVETLSQPRQDEYGEQWN